MVIDQTAFSSQSLSVHDKYKYTLLARHYDRFPPPQPYARWRKEFRLFIMLLVLSTIVGVAVTG